MSKNFKYLLVELSCDPQGIRHKLAISDYSTQIVPGLLKFLIYLNLAKKNLNYIKKINNNPIGVFSDEDNEIIVNSLYKQSIIYYTSIFSGSNDKLLEDFNPSLVLKKELDNICQCNFNKELYKLHNELLNIDRNKHLCHIDSFDNDPYFEKVYCSQTKRLQINELYSLSSRPIDKIEELIDIMTSIVENYVDFLHHIHDKKILEVISSSQEYKDELLGKLIPLHESKNTNNNQFKKNNSKFIMYLKPTKFSLNLTQGGLSFSTTFDEDVTIIW